MKWSTVSRLRIEVVLLPALIVLTGCARAIVLHPIETVDIFAVPQGSRVLMENKEIKVKKDGWFLSEYYLKEIMKVKEEK